MDNNKIEEIKKQGARRALRSTLNNALYQISQAAYKVEKSADLENFHEEMESIISFYEQAKKIFDAIQEMNKVNNESI